MRIEAYSQMQQVYKTQQVGRTQQVSKMAPAAQLQISSIGKDIQNAKSAVSAAPDIREDVTAPIKAKIQDGTYSVDNGSFAEKLLQKYQEMR